MIMTQPEAQQLDPEALRLLSIHEKGLHTALLTEVDELSKRGPLGPGVLGVASASLCALERYDEAVKTAHAALEQSPQQAWLHLALSRGEQGRGDWDRAIGAARIAVQLRPDEPAYVANLAKAYRLSGQLELALRTAQHALTLSPDHLEARRELGLTLEAEDDRAGALEQFRFAQTARPDDPEGYLLEGRLHQRVGAIGEARRAFREALRRHPGLEEAENLLAESLGGSSIVQKTLLHIMNLSRLTLVGWAITAFLYYLFFRLLEFIWKFVPVTLFIGQALLVVTLVWIFGGALAGWLVRAAFRVGWPK